MMVMAEWQRVEGALAEVLAQNGTNMRTAPVKAHEDQASPLHPPPFSFRPPPPLPPPPPGLFACVVVAWNVDESLWTRRGS